MTSVPVISISLGYSAKISQELLINFSNAVPTRIYSVASQLPFTRMHFFYQNAY